MRECVKNKWVNALRSGEYKQTRGCLNDGDSYCCLGVLCEVFIAEGNALDVRTPNGVTEYNGESSYPPNEVLKWAGIQTLNGHANNANYSVAAVNDYSDDFTPSIEYIEQNWENM